MMSNLVAEQLSLSCRTPLDLVVLFLVLFHLLFSLAAAIFVLHFHFRSILTTTTSSSSSSSSSVASLLRRRLRLLLGLNSLWPVRLLLVLFASLFSLSELLRLTVHHPVLCKAYALSSQAFAQPAFFATLLFLLRASTHTKPSSPYSLAFASAAVIAIAAAIPFALIHSLFLFLWPWILRKLLLPPDLLSSTQTSDDHHRCTHPLYNTVLLALLTTAYIPVFVSTCWTAVKVVINKKLRIRLYALTAVVVVALSTQVVLLALSTLLSPSLTVSEGLGMFSFAVVLMSIVVGEGILVVQPVVDALAIVTTPTLELELATVREAAAVGRNEGECLEEV